MTMTPRERSDYSAIVDRPVLKLPGDARMVIWTIVNLEVWDISKAMARQVIPAPTGVPLRLALTAGLLDVIANTMPQSDPGSLKPAEYAAVTAYIMQQNGYPAGTAALANSNRYSPNGEQERLIKTISTTLR